MDEKHLIKVPPEKSLELMAKRYDRFAGIAKHFTTLSLALMAGSLSWATILDSGPVFQLLILGCCLCSFAGACWLFIKMALVSDIEGAHSVLQSTDRQVTEQIMVPFMFMVGGVIGVIFVFIAMILERML